MEWLSRSNRKSSLSEGEPHPHPGEAPAEMATTGSKGESLGSNSTAWDGDIIDRDRLELMSNELGTEMMDRLTSLFWVDLENLMAQVQSPTAISDLLATRRVFHTIKGSAETIGFKTISEASVRAGELFRETGAIDLLELERAVQLTRSSLAPQR